MDALRFRIAKGEGEEVAKMLGPLRSVLAPLFPQLESASDTGERVGPGRCQTLNVLTAESDGGAGRIDVSFARQSDAQQRIGLRTAADELHAAHPLRRLLGSLARDRVGEEMRLAPLDREETAEMLRCMLETEPDPAFAAAIWRRSEGNPFFVEELPSVLARDGSRTATSVRQAR